MQVPNGLEKGNFRNKTFRLTDDFAGNIRLFADSIRLFVGCIRLLSTEQPESAFVLDGFPDLLVYQNIFPHTCG